MAGKALVDSNGEDGHEDLKHHAEVHELQPRVVVTCTCCAGCRLGAPAVEQLRYQDDYSSATSDEREASLTLPRY